MSTPPSIPQDNMLIFVVGEQHGAHAANELAWINHLQSISQRELFKVLLVREATDIEATSDLFRPTPSDFDVTVVGIEEEDLKLDIDMRVFIYLKMQNKIPAPVLPSNFDMLSEDERIAKINELEKHCSTKWTCDYEARRALEDEYRVPLKRADDLTGAIQEDYSLWKTMFLSCCDRRLLMAPQWCKRLKRLAEEHQDKDFLVILGAAHLGTAITDTGQYPGLLPLIMKEPGPFKFIGWSWSHKPDAKFTDTFLQDDRATEPGFVHLYDCSNQEIETVDIASPTTTPSPCDVM